ncbi:hypothetical protein ACSXAB_01290 [Clostridium perfringens]
MKIYRSILEDSIKALTPFNVSIYYRIENDNKIEINKYTTE